MSTLQSIDVIFWLFQSAILIVNGVLLHRGLQARPRLAADGRSLVGGLVVLVLGWMVGLLAYGFGAGLVIGGMVLSNSDVSPQSAGMVAGWVGGLLSLVVVIGARVLYVRYGLRRASAGALVACPWVWVLARFLLAGFQSVLAKWEDSDDSLFESCSDVGCCRSSGRLRSCGRSSE